MELLLKEVDILEADSGYHLSSLLKSKHEVIKKNKKWIKNEVSGIHNRT